MLQGLNPREREVIILRFGLETGHPLTLEEVGKRFNVTRERIRQIETAALRKLRNPSKKQENQGFPSVKRDISVRDKTYYSCFTS